MAITISGENNNDKILATDGVIDQISGFSIVGVMTATSFVGDLTGNVTGNLTGNVNSTSPLLLQTGGSERIRLTGNNEIGIAGANYGSAGQVLTSGGSGSAVTWSAIPAQITFSNPSNNRILTSEGGIGVNAEANLTFDGTNLKNIGSGYRQLYLGSTNAGGVAIVLDGDSNGDGIGSDYAYIAHDTGGDVIIGGDNPSGDAAIIFKAGNNSEKLRITSGGQVNIGNSLTQTTRLFTVETTYASGGEVAYFGNNDGSNNYGGLLISAGEIDRECRLESAWGNSFFTFHTQSDGAGAGERLRIAPNGNIGIGTDNPTDLLDVFKNSSTAYDATDDSAQRNASASITIRNDNGTTNTFSQLVFDTAGSNQSIARIVALRTGAASNALTFVTEHSNTKAERLRIDSSGRVLVNTTTTNNGNNKMIIEGPSPGGTYAPYDGQLVLKNSETSGAINTGSALVFFGHDGGNQRGSGAIRCLKENGISGNHDFYMSFLTRVDGGSNTEKLRIKSDGKLMTQAAGFIYTASSAGSLTLGGGNTNLGGKIVLSGGNSPGTGDIRFYAQMSQSSPAERLRINSSGFVNIGPAADPRKRLDITGPDGRSGASSGNSDTALLIDNASTNGAIIEMMSDNNAYGRIFFTDTDASNQGQIVYQHGNDTFQFSTDGDERLRINKYGTLEINSVKPRIFSPNTGSTNSYYWKIGSTKLNGSEGFILTFCGTGGYSNGQQIAGFTKVVARCSNASTLVGYRTGSSIGATLGILDVRWKHEGSQVFSIWAKVQHYTQITPLVDFFGGGSGGYWTPDNTNTNSTSAPSGSTAFSDWEYKQINGVNTIQYTASDTHFLQNIRMAQGKGIDFGAAADVGTGETVSNSILRDYEEGTFLPTLYYGTGTSQPTYSWRYGHYIKVGKQVTIWFMIGIASFSGTNFSQAWIGGLPFQAADPNGQWKYLNHMMGYEYASGWGDSSNENQIFLAIYDNQSKLMLNHDGNHLQTGNIGNNQRFASTVTYQTD